MIRMTATTAALRGRIQRAETELASLDEDITAFNAIKKSSKALHKLLARYEVAERLENDRRGVQTELDRLNMDLAVERIEFVPGDANHYCSIIKLTNGSEHMMARTPGSAHGELLSAVRAGTTVTFPVMIDGEHSGHARAVEVDPADVERVS
jgi:hypothetical protein